MTKPYIGLPVQYKLGDTKVAAVITAINPVAEDNIQTVNLTLFPDGGGTDHVKETIDWELIPVDLPE